MQSRRTATGTKTITAGKQSAVRTGFNKERRRYTSTSHHPSELLLTASVLVPVCNASRG
jgi:hypothetical protein